MERQPRRRSESDDLISPNDSNRWIQILFLGHGTEEKGLFDALDVVRIWLERFPLARARLILAGGTAPELQERLERSLDGIAESHPGRFECTQVGFVDGEHKDALMQSSDVLLSCSRWESFGLTVVEAMAHGLPVVAALSDGVRGVLPDSYPYTANVRDCEGIADALARCVDEVILNPADSGLRDCLRKRFETTFRMAKYKTTIVSILEGVGYKTKQP